jgi:DedD protein
VARSPVTDEEIQLRKRARRRLVGAIALVIVAVAAVPILLDSEPRGMQPTPEVHIPAVPADTVPQRPVTIQPDSSASDAALPPEPSPAPLPAEPAPEAGAVQQAQNTAPAEPEVSAPPVTPQSVPADQQPTRALEQNTQEKAPGGTKSGYVVQLIATGSPDKARELKRRLEKLKFPVYTEKTPDGGKTRVRVGPFAKEGAAQAARQRLIELGFDPGKVVGKGE